MTRRIDILEVGGDGGVYQHTIAVAKALDSTAIVTVHTSNSRESLGNPSHMCECFDWYRHVTHLRRLRISQSFLLRTLPHFITKASDVAWVQGQFKTPLTLAAILALRLCGRRVVFSPHNTFARTGSRFDYMLLRLSMRSAHHVVLYNRADLHRVKLANAVVLPLLMWIPEISPEIERDWSWVRREDFDVAALGHIRSDKNLPLLVAAAGIGGLKLLIVGPDKGALMELREAVARSSADVRILANYVDLSALACIARDVGVVALPYQVASQSAVAVLANSMGATVVAHSTGGLAEQADVVVDSLEASVWARAIRSAKRDRPSAAKDAPDSEVIEFIARIP